MALSRSVRNCIAIVVSSCAVLSTGRCAALYEGDYWSPLDVPATLAASAQMTPATLPESDDATVEQRSLRFYHDDGTGESQDESYVKILTEKGRRRNNTVNLGFQLPYNTVEVVRLEIFKPSGAVVPVDIEANSKESIDDSQMEMNIYDPNSRQLRVNIPQLEVGDTVHLISRDTTHRAIIPGEYAEDEMMESASFIRHLTFEVRGPATKPLRTIRLRNEVSKTVTTSTANSDDGRTLVYRWEARNVPRMYEESGMPSALVVLQRLSISTTPDWAAVSRWAWKVDEPHIDATDEDLKKTVAELIAGQKTDADRTKAIFYYVSKNIRYMGITPEKDLPGFEPHDVKLTFAKKYGVCRDKAALLVSMLRAANLPAYPVLISYGTKKDEEVPNPFFNHEIACLDQGNGHYVLMDPTDENTRDLLPSLEGNQSFLVCRPEGETLRTSPVNDPEKSMLRVKTTGSLSAAGALTAHAELLFDGVNDNMYRGAFAQMKAEDQWRFFEGNLKRAVPGATLKSLKILPENLLDSTDMLRVEMDFSASDTVAFGSGKGLVNMPWIGKETGIVNFILNGTGLDKRTYPLETYVACGVHEDISLQTAPEFTGAVAVPNSSPQDDALVSYRRTFDFHDGHLSATRDLKLKQVEFSPAQYLELKKILATLQIDDRKAPLLAATHTDSDSQLLNAAGIIPPSSTDSRILTIAKEIAVQDEHTATLKVRSIKKVLNYSGKKKEGEVKIGYNPSTEEVKIIHAIVTSKEGKRQEISPEEINQMDEGWNASAKRYTGGKILVLSLPGVDIDSTIELEYQVKWHDRASLSGFEALQTGEACDDRTLTVTAPKNLVLIHELRGEKAGISETKTKTDAQQSYHWRASLLDAIPSEGNAPPRWLFAPGVAFFAGSAESYWKTLDREFSAHAAQSTKTSALAKNLVAGAKTKPEAIIAIRNFVDRSIRAAGPGFRELSLKELSDADTTLQDGYGHGADRAILLHAMLSAAGFAPRFVFASELPDVEKIAVIAKTTPFCDAFDSPLIEVSVEGQTYYLNDTDQYAHLGATPHDGKLAIFGDNGTYSTIHAAPDAPAKSEELYSLAMADNGDAVIEITRKYYGTDWGDKKKFFTELPPEERRRYHQEQVTSLGQGARAASELTTDFDHYPGVETFSVAMDHYGVAENRYLYFDSPAHPGLLPAETDQRALPYFVSEHHRQIIRTEITLPPSYRKVVIAPKERLAKSASSSLGSVQVNTEQSSGRLVISQILDLNPGIVGPADYPALATLETNLENKSSRLLLLEAETRK